MSLVKHCPFLLTGEALRKAARSLHGRIDFHGLDVSVENRMGSIRQWHDPHTGEDGMTRMRRPYGYIKGTLGGDGDHYDVFIGPHRDAKMVYIVSQMKAPDFTKPDEEKALLGFASQAEARKFYLQHYDDPRFLGKITAKTLVEFTDDVMKTKQNGGRPIVKAIDRFAERIMAALRKSKQLGLSDAHHAAYDRTTASGKTVHVEAKGAQRPRFTFKVKPHGDRFIIESDNGGGRVIEGKPKGLWEGGNAAKMFPSAAHAHAYAAKKGIEIEAAVPQPTGAATIAARQNNAMNSFVQSATEQFGLSRDEAEAALTYYRKHKLIKIDAAGGQYSLADGRLWDKAALKRAAELKKAEPEDDQLQTKGGLIQEGTLRAYARGFSRNVIKQAGGNPDALDIDEAAKGYLVEFEHADVTGGDPETTMKIVLAHLAERNDYYTRLEKYVEKAVPGVRLLRKRDKA